MVVGMICFVLRTPSLGMIQASIFQHLNADVNALEKGETSVSLLGKWLPSVNAFASTKRGKYFASFSTTTIRIPQNFSKLRTAIDVLKEDDQQWSEITIKSSKCYEDLTRTFSRNDEARYEYLEDVAMAKENQCFYFVSYDIVKKFL